MMKASKAEFDAYAKGYEGGLDNPVKSLLGDSADDFIAVKIRWLLRFWPELRTDASLSILDYGCGAATLSRLLRQAGVAGALTGTDVSTGMLAEAQSTWPAAFPPPAFHAQDGAATGLPADGFDLAIISAVLHHVPPDERVQVYGELHRVLRPGGRLVVFEHNPWNPVTRFVVARTPIDQDAILLPHPEVTRALRSGGWNDIRTGHLMFLPPKAAGLATLAERLFPWLPLGGQYAVTARK